jgi:hypothetical protein
MHLDRFTSHQAQRTHPCTLHGTALSVTSVAFVFFLSRFYLPQIMLQSDLQ